MEVDGYDLVEEHRKRCEEMKTKILLKIEFIKKEDES